MQEDKIKMLENDKYQLVVIGSKYELATDELNEQVDKINSIIKDYDDHKYELISKEIGPKQIKEYDKILVNKGEGLEGRRYWMCDFAAGWTNENPYYEKRLMTIIQPNVKEIYYNILPYNNETKKLIGTNYSIPIYYHYPIWVESRIKAIKENPDNWNAIDDIILNIKYN